MFTYSHANTPLGQSERMYYLSYFIKNAACLLTASVKFYIANIYILTAVTVAIYTLPTTRKGCGNAIFQHGLFHSEV